jgi:hypothetical protein
MRPFLIFAGCDIATLGSLAGLAIAQLAVVDSGGGNGNKTGDSSDANAGRDDTSPRIRKTP